MTKSDRRAQRTRDLLQQALIELMSEHRYDAITIRDIADRADRGRTTFYLHYSSKDELFMSCHEAIVSTFHFGPFYALSREELLSSDVPQGMISAYQHLEEARTLLRPIFHGTVSLPILRRIRDWSAQEIEASLRAAFAEGDSTIPVDVLANYLAGAQIGLVQWWLKKRRPYTPENLAQTFHRMQRAALRDAFRIPDAE